MRATCSKPACVQPKLSVQQTERSLCHPGTRSLPTILDHISTNASARNPRCTVTLQNFEPGAQESPPTCAHLQLLQVNVQTRHSRVGARSQHGRAMHQCQAGHHAVQGGGCAAGAGAVAVLAAEWDVRDGAVPKGCVG